MVCVPSYLGQLRDESGILVKEMPISCRFKASDRNTFEELAVAVGSYGILSKLKLSNCLLHDSVFTHLNRIHRFIRHLLRHICHRPYFIKSPKLFLSLLG
jgi:hypothetical protein